MASAVSVASRAPPGMAAPFRPVSSCSSASVSVRAAGSNVAWVRSFAASSVRSASAPMAPLSSWNASSTGNGAPGRTAALVNCSASRVWRVPAWWSVRLMRAERSSSVPIASAAAPRSGADGPSSSVAWACGASAGAACGLAQLALPSALRTSSTKRPSTTMRSISSSPRSIGSRRARASSCATRASGASPNSGRLARLRSRASTPSQGKIDRPISPPMFRARPVWRWISDARRSR